MGFRQRSPRGGGPAVRFNTCEGRGRRGDAAESRHRKRRRSRREVFGGNRKDARAQLRRGSTPTPPVPREREPSASASNFRRCPLTRPRRAQDGGVRRRRPPVPKSVGSAGAPAAAVRSDCPARPNAPLPFRDAPSEAKDESKEDITHPPRRPDRRPVQFGRSWWGYVMGFVRGRVRFYVHHALPPGYGRTAGGWPGDAQRTH